nr:rRNA maturation RNase YbeY [uncultured Moraxella sp.]
MTTDSFHNDPDSDLDIVISFSEALLNQANFSQIEPFYDIDKVQNIVKTMFEYFWQNDVNFPQVNKKLIKNKALELDIYVVEPIEGQAINLDARGKDYATNILSYPSDLPENIAEVLPSFVLGELVICHDVVAKQADEQGKTVEEHLTHLLVHGILHLLGFDHELGQAEQDEMEGLEIAILAQLNIANPYEN